MPLYQCQLYIQYLDSYSKKLNPINIHLCAPYLKNFRSIRFQSEKLAMKSSERYWKENSSSFSTLPQSEAIYDCKRTKYCLPFFLGGPFSSVSGGIDSAINFTYWRNFREYTPTIVYLFPWKTLPAARTMLGSSNTLSSDELYSISV